MGRLVGLVFSDPFKAEEARAALHRMEADGPLEMDETAIVTMHKDGRVRISQDFSVVAKDRDHGHLLSLVITAVTGAAPLVSADNNSRPAIGGLPDDAAVNDFVKELRKAVQPGKSVLLVLVRSNAERSQKAFECLQYFKPTCFELDLPLELEHDPGRSLARNEKSQSVGGSAGISPE